jgi:polar amino acid transport system substrate-binding protein
MNIPYPPWEMYVKVGGNEVTGCDYDLAAALAAKMGLKVKILQFPSVGSLIPAVQAGKADTLISCISDTKLREQAVDFVDYAESGTTILTKKGNPAHLTGFDSLSGKTVCIVTSSSQTPVANKLNAEFQAAGKPPMKIIQLPSSSDLTLSIVSGKVEASLVDLTNGIYSAETYQGGNALQVIADPAYPNGMLADPIGIGVLKSDSELRDAFQTALQSLMNDGTYRAIFEKYGLGAATVKAPTINGATS